ncbi:hypothetical protein SAMD00023353_3900330 [Rosellinia necatrix]|uniref:Uncharacterized protein n=1 Tax=Rosellinia necatrix TaxID=77044 RepID=A0A1S8A906_ROSNE|nr:hypothetical protein SAMD00023353_3900330 [Rosellinia necatrix]
MRLFSGELDAESHDIGSWSSLRPRPPHVAERLLHEISPRGRHAQGLVRPHENITSNPRAPHHFRTIGSRAETHGYPTSTEAETTLSELHAGLHTANEAGLDVFHELHGHMHM